ncbi:NTP transferase domain-containing protein [Altererythrobacter arenosus]|uniref:NTP transferase domain-containing protein n=1 Tax=Altererythrobacter arenosus TaxID=3032592 RepID=A0ABY8FQ81_9SPHN|nr:NTP transferase domain-containing protein [Altererythrobacter sp. CAU 1644]WFL77174.1 NTP transferase domain-containing protein [Altererythrobacter sp. CAU 1644]
MEENTAPFAALVLAGTRPGGDPLAHELGVPHKGLIEFGGEASLARVVAALRQAGAARIAVSCDEAGPIARLALDLGAETLPAARGPSGSALAALAAMGAPMLVTTSDHALLRPEWVRQCLRDTPGDADLGVMLAERAVIERAVPGSQRTFLKFADGQWSGCNLFFLRTDRAKEAMLLWNRLEQDRKQPWRMAFRIGIGMLLRYLTGGLSMANAIERVGKRIGIEARLVSAEDGLAAVDVDKMRDVELVRSLVESA